MILKCSIEKLMRKENLASDLCRQALEEMLSAENPMQTAAFLVLLRAKPETTEELAAIVNTLRDKMLVVPTKHMVLDIVGTGGDGLNTVNISTGSAILAASCGVKIAKHGNRAASSLAGSADVLEALGVGTNLSPEKISMSIDQIGIGFCYSPNFHPVTCKLRELRKQLNVPTSFNLLGPLLNPANAMHLVLGVLDDALLIKMADLVKRTGNGRSVVVHGCGLDEISCVGPSKIIEITPKENIESVIDPVEFGLSYCRISDLQGGEAVTNAQLLLDAFRGKRKEIGETLILNAAVALYIYGIFSSIKEAIPFASEKLYGGAALTLLKNWVEFCHD